MKNKILKLLTAFIAFIGIIGLASCNNNTNNPGSGSGEGEGGGGQGGGEGGGGQGTKEKDPLEGEVFETFYVSPTATTASGNGTEANPYSFIDACEAAGPGDTILLAPGTYEYEYRQELKNSGFATAYITVKPQSAGRVIFDFHKMEFDSALRGIQIYGDYWHFQDIEVCHAGDNGMYVAGSYNIIENCMFYSNQDTGLQLGRAYSEDTQISDWPSFNLIKNCTSFANFDAPTYGENADGFAAKLTVGFGNVFDGCIAFRNSDDGWDMYAKEDSGNIGTVMLYNCVSFENGFLPYQIERTDSEGQTYMSYDTLNGDGIGFKLGGSVMEGDVIVENCLAFNNKLHGFGDNSNPGFLDLRNCTAYNNCIGLDNNGNVGSVRGEGLSSNKSNNFDLARSITSYNSYYGLLSFIDNQDDFNTSTEGAENNYNNDKYRGIVAYSIFQTSYNNKQEIYRIYGAPEDASIYNTQSTDVAFSGGTIKNEYVKTSDFKDLTPINAKCSSEATLSDLFELDAQLRNEDKSVNMGDLVALADDSALKTYCDGKPVGATLNKTKYSDYTHYDTLNFEGCKTYDQATVSAVKNTLEVLTNINGTFQDFEIAKVIAGAEIRWTSNNTNVIRIDNSEKISASVSAFSTAVINSPAEKTTVKLTATITKGEVTATKEFDVVVMPRKQSLGDLVSTSKDNLFKVLMYGTFVEPTIYATDSSSNTQSKLSTSLYTKEKTYLYATDANSKFVEVDGIYTSVPGVYKVVTKAILNSDATITEEYTYSVYILDPDCNIDVKGNPIVVLNNSGFAVKTEVSNVYGDIYAITSSTALTGLNAEQLIARTDVEVLPINSDYISAEFSGDNSGVYYGYYVVLNKNKSNVATAIVRSFEVKVINVTTKDEFYDLATTGKIGSEVPSTTTIYSLQNDLDFTGYMAPTNASYDTNWNLREKASEYASFSSLFTGNNHTISNIKINVDSANKNANIFYKVSNGTVMNVNFENISITNRNGSKGQIGIIGDLQGGYVHDVHVTRVSMKGREGVGGIIGIVSGNTNYVSNCSFANPYTYTADILAQAAEKKIDPLYLVTKVTDFTSEYSMGATNKYVGGIIGNVQKNSDQAMVNLTVRDCYANGIIGDGKDAGGNTGGIIGRVKNETEKYNIDVQRCYYKGVIIAKGNYNAGIIGQFDNGLGNVTIKYNYSDSVFFLGGETLNAYQAYLTFSDQHYAHKNTNSIVGRAVGTTDVSVYITANNYGTWKEYYDKFIFSYSIIYDLSENDEDSGTYKLFTLTEDWIKSNLGFDLVNTWSFDAQTCTLTLRNK